MKYYTPFSIEITDSDIGEYENADGTINMPWSRSEQIDGPGVIRQYDNKIYKSLSAIKPLVTYIWQDADPLNKYNITTLTDTTDDGTAVPIVNAVTTVYVVSQDKYYIAKTTGTIDFTGEDYDSPADFNPVTDNSLRHEYYIPEIGSLKWSYQGVSNRTASVSQAINRFSTKNATSFYQEFIVSGADAITLYNVKADSIVFEARKTSDNTLLDTQTIDGVELGFTSFREWFDSSYEDPNYDTKVVVKPDYYIVDPVKIRITATNAVENPQIGEILPGRIKDGGETQDGVNNPTQTDSEIRENIAGELVIDGEGDASRVWRAMSIKSLIDTAAYDLYSKATEDIINKRVIVIGENTDSPQYRSLILYALAQEATPTLQSNADKSSIDFQFRELKAG